MTSLVKRTNIVMGLPFRELRPTPCSPSSIFLSFFDPRIPGEETGLLQRILELGIILKQCL